LPVWAGVVQLFVAAPSADPHLQQGITPTQFYVHNYTCIPAQVRDDDCSKVAEWSELCLLIVAEENNNLVESVAYSSLANQIVRYSHQIEFEPLDKPSSGVFW